MRKLIGMERMEGSRGYMKHMRCRGIEFLNYAARLGHAMSQFWQQSHFLDGLFGGDGSASRLHFTTYIGSYT